MTFQDFSYFLYVACSLAVIVVATRRRCWLLVFGYVLSLVVDIQVIVRKILRIAGTPLGSSVSPLSAINRILSIVSVVLITVAIIRLLQQFKSKDSV